VDKSIRKIVIVLVFIILLPALFFAVYEINSLSSNERIIDRIYSNQVEAILFSVNQFSEDIVGSWRSKIKVIRDTKNNKSMEMEIRKFLLQNSSVKFIFFDDSTGSNTLFTLEKGPHVDIVKIVKRELLENESKIERLFNYSREGYNKIEPISIKLKNISAVVTIIELTRGKELLGLAIDPQLFIKQILNPKIQSISQNEFIISVFNKTSRENIYSTEGINVGDIQNEKDLWLLPEYSLGIVLKGGTIQSLVKERAEINLLLLLLLIIILFAGGWIIFRNIKKEIALAKIKSDFVSNVSHELRTPLALISMFAETLEMGRVKTEEKKNEYYTIISHETARLGRIVNRILNFSQMEAGKRKYNFSKVQLNVIIEEVFNTYKFHLQNKGFKFVSNPDENIPLIYADKEAVSEAIINIIDNAVKYSDDIKEVELSTGTMGELVYVKIKDHGIGISDQDQKKIFDKFFRVSSGYVHNTKGTGLGLSLVKHIMDAHNGEITLHSTLGNGSSFILKFKTSQ
jgi:two-component system, OmpR family, phosphate regulon sensor histidine kinase PhoR